MFVLVAQVLYNAIPLGTISKYISLQKKKCTQVQIKIRKDNYPDPDVTCINEEKRTQKAADDRTRPRLLLAIVHTEHIHKTGRTFL